MEPYKELLEYGVLGLTAGIAFYLFFSERRKLGRLQKQYLNQQIKDTSAKSMLATSFENLEKVIRLNHNLVQRQIDGLESAVDDSIERTDKIWVAMQIEQEVNKRITREVPASNLDPRSSSNLDPPSPSVSGSPSHSDLDPLSPPKPPFRRKVPTQPLKTKTQPLKPKKDTKAK